MSRCVPKTPASAHSTAAHTDPRHSVFGSRGSHHPRRRCTGKQHSPCLGSVSTLSHRDRPLSCRSSALQVGFDNARDRGPEILSIMSDSDAEEEITEQPTPFELSQRIDKQRPLIRVRLSVHYRVHSRQVRVAVPALSTVQLSSGSCPLLTSAYSVLYLMSSLCCPVTCVAQILCIGGDRIPFGWSFLSIAKVPMTWENGDVWTCEVSPPLVKPFAWMPLFSSAWLPGLAAVITHTFPYFCAGRAASRTASGVQVCDLGRAGEQICGNLCLLCQVCNSHPAPVITGDHSNPAIPCQLVHVCSAFPNQSCFCVWCPPQLPRPLQSPATVFAHHLHIPSWPPLAILLLPSSRPRRTFEFCQCAYAHP